MSVHAPNSIPAAKASPRPYTSCRKEQRPHRSLDERMPDHVYFTSLPLAEAAQSEGASSTETYLKRLTKTTAATSPQTRSDE
jgi:hypothetical protein